MIDFPYKTFGGWVKSYGLKISDLNEEDLASAKEEYEARKRGDAVLDGILDELSWVKNSPFKL